MKIISNNEKRCPHCKEIKPCSEFSRNKSRLDGLSSWCKICQKLERDGDNGKIRKKRYKATHKDEIKIYEKRYRETNKEKIKIRGKLYREIHKDDLNARGKRYKDTNKEKVRAQTKGYREANKEKLMIRDKRYKETHKDEIKIRTKQYIEKNKEKIKIREKRYKEANKEKIAIYRKQYNKKNKEKLKKQHAEYYKNHADHLVEYSRTWQKNNPEKVKILRVITGHKYRARKHHAEGSHTIADIQHLREVQGGRCLMCGKRTKLSVDHIVPISKGGRDDITNLQLLCVSCNSSKQAKTKDFRSKKLLAKIFVQQELFA